MAKTLEQKKFASYVQSLEPYCVIVKNDRISGGYYCCPNATQLGNYLESDVIDDTKVYLRPMSSMTEEEREEFENLFPRYSISEDRGSIYHNCRGDLNLDIIDWLNSHFFDYRGWIEK